LVTRTAGDTSVRRKEHRDLANDNRVPPLLDRTLQKHQETEGKKSKTESTFKTKTCLDLMVGLVFQTTAQQCRPQSTVLRFDSQVVNADYDNRVQDEYDEGKKSRTGSTFKTEVETTKCQSCEWHRVTRTVYRLG
jgi:hypothetical protein